MRLRIALNTGVLCKLPSAVGDKTNILYFAICFIVKSLLIFVLKINISYFPEYCRLVCISNEDAI